MRILVVTYDLHNESRRPSIVAAIKKGAASWKMLSESSYAIETSRSPQQVYDDLKRHFDSNDRVVVITLTNPWFGYHSNDVDDWLMSKLGN